MSSDCCKLADIAYIQGGYAFKSTDFGKEGVAVVKIANIKPPLVSLDGIDRIKPDKLQGLDRFRLSDGDVLMAMTGATVGKVGRFRQNEPAYLNQRVARISARHGKEYDDFIYAVVSQPGFELLIEGASAGSAQANISTSGIGEVQIPLLSCEEQLVIGQLARMLDDYISLLRETNATLEAIAQALFKSWFVDFDPVRAKMEGRVPDGMDEATAALFPDSFEETELGEVPRGWPVSCVGDVAEVVKGKSYSSKDLVSTHHTALVTLKSFERGGGFRMDGFKPYVGAYKPSQVVRAGDLIVAYTDVTQAAELIGKPAIVVGVDTFDTLVASLDVGIIRPVSRSSKFFLYGLCRTDAFQAHTLAHTSGTTVLHLAKDGVESFLFPCPPVILIERFEEVTSALMARKQINSDAIRNLSDLRDTLLPRLISGQLRLPVKAVTEDVSHD